jgi:hypothetical protein
VDAKSLIERIQRRALQRAWQSLARQAGGGNRIRRHIAERDIPLTQPPYLLAALKPYLPPTVGAEKEYYFWTFDPDAVTAGHHRRD